jgi:hypothetical protein
MLFQFQPCANPDVGRTAFELPPIPPGTSHGLRLLINVYVNAVREGNDTVEDGPYLAIYKFDATSISDTIAKLLIRLHFDHPGLDDDRLVLCVVGEDASDVHKAEDVLSDLYRQLPATWEGARCACTAAVAAERDYEVRFWEPARKASYNGGPRIPAHVDKEMARLQDVRWCAEEVLLDMPAPSLEEFAVKYLICFDSGRDNNGYTTALCAEAKRLLGVADDPEAEALTTLLANLNWRASR